MSIDAKIRDVEETLEGVLLHLEPRRTGHGWSLPGQKTLLIEQPTWTPEYGMIVFGGESMVMIGTGQSNLKCYQRQGYTRLREARIRRSE